MAQNVNPRSSGTTSFDKDAADRGSATSSAQVSLQRILNIKAKYIIWFCSLHFEA